MHRATESQRLRSILSEKIKVEQELQEFTDTNFVTEVLDEKGRLVVFDFWADYCIACKSLHRSMLRLKDDLPLVKLGRVDAEKNPELVRAFNLKAIPHLVAVMHGDVVLEFVGDKPYEGLLQKITELDRLSREGKQDAA